MRKEVRILFAVAVFLLVAPQRLPAPIVEEEKATPAPEEQSKPKVKHSKKTKSDESQASARQQVSPKQSRFAGTWVGTMPAFPTGPQATVLTVDFKEATMQHTWTDHPPTRLARAEINGNTIRATFPNGIATYTFSLTPERDGTTAHARLQAFMNDNTAVFHRVAESSTNKIAR
jgi:hypothetical protein